MESLAPFLYFCKNLLNEKIYFTFDIFIPIHRWSTTGSKWMKGIAPRNIGPGGMSGRVTAIDVVNKNRDVFM